MATVRVEAARRIPSGTQYEFGAIVLHWAMFVLVVIVGTLGLLHDSWPKSTQQFWINIHALFGIALWLTLLARVAYRIRHAPPTLPADVGAFSRRMSSPVHLTLYALLFVIPIIGMVTFVYHGRSLDLGFFQVDFGIKKNRAIFEPTEDVHGYLAYALFGLAGLHAMAALWHHFIRRDAVLRRMWPRAR
jgi:cytochrome b561